MTPQPPAPVGGTTEMLEYLKRALLWALLPLGIVFYDVIVWHVVYHRELLARSPGRWPEINANMETAIANLLLAILIHVIGFIALATMDWRIWKWRPWKSAPLTGAQKARD